VEKNELSQGQLDRFSVTKKSEERHGVTKKQKTNLRNKFKRINFFRARSKIKWQLQPTLKTF
jgi:hypothetical protein